MQNIATTLFLLTLAACATSTNPSTQIPEPKSWAFPAVIDSARAISPKNIDGLAFNEYGLAYSMDEILSLKVSEMRPADLQKYADIVTHAYPDAVWKQVPSSCENIDVLATNTTTIAGMAYVSIHAINENTRIKAAKCLSIAQEKLRKLRAY